MKCQNCGNHEANFHYKSNVNGQITEQHLCQECAGKMQDSVFAKTQSSIQDEFNQMQSIFSPTGMFGGGSMIDNMTRGFFDSFWPSPQVIMINPPAQTQTQPQHSQMPASEKEAAIPTDAGDKFRKRREINKLRCEMKSAIKDENFERAAEIRDEIYKMEKEDNKD